MTAIENKRYTLNCDNQLSCPAVFKGQSREQRARVRKRARAAGWTTVKNGIGPYYDDDYCPAHKPEGS